MRSGFLPARVVHLHPTRACNLACAHCYSDSSPSVGGALDVELLVDALAALREEGYEVLSVSGGEPLVYRPLPRLLEGAVGLGYRVHLITNGIALDRRRLEAWAAHAGLVGVSVDGDAETHNLVRGRPDAYARACRALEALAEAGVASAIVYAASARSLPGVPGAYELARAAGASLLHLRPLALEGRARGMDAAWTLDAADRARLFVLAEILSGARPDGPRVQVDLAPADRIAEARCQFELLLPEPRVAMLSDAVNPLVVDEQGRCMPFAYGVHPRYTLSRLSPAVPLSFRPHDRWTAGVRDLLERAFATAAEEPGGFIDFFANLARVSRDGAPAGALPVVA